MYFLQYIRGRRGPVGTLTITKIGEEANLYQKIFSI